MIEDRICRKCGTNIDHRHGLAKICESIECKRSVDADHQASSRIRKSDKRDSCLYCPNPIGWRCSHTCGSPECQKKRKSAVMIKKKVRLEKLIKKSERYKNRERKKLIKPRLREYWFERQSGKCYLCGLEIKKELLHLYHLEHGIPVSRGGKDITGLACPECNIDKGDMTLEEYFASDRSKGGFTGILGRYSDLKLERRK